MVCGTTENIIWFGMHLICDENFLRQNAYLASRIDGQEEEKNSLKGEIKKASDRFADFTKSSQHKWEDMNSILMQFNIESL